MILFVINIFCTLLFISSAIVWSEQANQRAAIACVVAGSILVCTIPTQIYLHLRHTVKTRAIDNE